jgi:UDP-N-acetylmuramoyl-L-alanyl-D-glutamate--2,6-diaminopimelate ligase
MALPVLADVDAACTWLRMQSARGLSADTRSLPAGAALLAWQGARHDARAHVVAALASGRCVAAIVEANGAEAFDWPPGARVSAYAGLRAAAGPIANRFFDAPSHHLAVHAVTGTNGKTSVSWWLAQALDAVGQPCGVIGTLGVGRPHADLSETGLTTPDAVHLHATLRRFVDAGLSACTIEASSIGLVEGRMDALRIRTALFTNLTQDHLDYHGSMAAYWAAKRRLFDWPGLAVAVVHVGDPHGAELADHLAATRPEVALWTVAADASRPARLQVLDGGYGPDGGLCLELVEGDSRVRARCALVGDFNRQNLAVVAGALRAEGVALADVARALTALRPVPGRMQHVAGDATGPVVVVDYAHTPDALAKVLAALRPLADRRGGTLWCVFGCGGNRDPGKRPAMAAAAELGADRLVMTSDNPRNEDPRDILAQMVAGLGDADAAIVIEDRRQAIAHAIGQAQAQDVVLLAGKGHEATQEIAGVRQPFSDAAEAAAALAQRSPADAGKRRVEVRP